MRALHLRAGQCYSWRWKVSDETRRMYKCANCDEWADGECTEAEVREQGFWSLDDDWFCSECTTFTVCEQ